jgi:hypothetical protein
MEDIGRKEGKNSGLRGELESLYTPSLSRRFQKAPMVFGRSFR